MNAIAFVGRELPFSVFRFDWGLHLLGPQLDPRAAAD